MLKGAPGGSRGFILPLTLWLIAGLLLAVAVLDQWTQKYFEQELWLQQRFESRLREESVLARLKYHLAVQVPGTAGLALGAGNQRIALDGRVYRTPADVYFTLEDLSNLVNLNAPWNNGALPGLLARLGVPVEERQRFIRRLVDYIDSDQRVEPGGAERNAYREARRSGTNTRPLPTPGDGRPGGANRSDSGAAGRLSPGIPDGPANRLLLSSLEALRVLGWQRLASPEGVRLLRDWAHAWGAGGTVNLNTAQAEVLGLLPWLDAGSVQRLLAERSNRPFASIEDFKRRMGMPDLQLDDLDYLFEPTGYLRIRVWRKGDGTLTDATLRLTPDSMGTGPWLVAFRHSHENTLSEQHAEEIALLAD